MTRHGQENLKPYHEMTAEQRREFHSKGGKASQAAAKKRKTMRDAILMMLDSKPTPAMMDAFAEKFDFNPKDLRELITGGLFLKAAAGDVKAYEAIRDTAGEKPETKTTIDGGLAVQKVFVTEKEKKNADKHIDDVING